MNKDWVGNKNSIYKTLGASNHTSEEREENDYYATDPIAAKYLIELENLDNYILEPACGEGHLAQIFREFGFNVVANDLIDRGYGNVQDFFEVGSWKGDIVTNPPYSIAEEFVRHSLNVISTGNKVCMFLKLQFLEGKKRKELFKELDTNNYHYRESFILISIYNLKLIKQHGFFLFYTFTYAHEKTAYKSYDTTIKGWIEIDKKIFFDSVKDESLIEIQSSKYSFYDQCNYNHNCLLETIRDKGYEVNFIQKLDYWDRSDYYIVKKPTLTKPARKYDINIVK